MRTLTLEELLEAGCHFGHQVTRHNPKSRDFVFEARDNIHIIDLAKTKEGLEAAAHFIKSIAEKPDTTLLILGTKRQAEAIVKEEAKRAEEEKAGIYTVTTRWIGGTLTNFGEVTKNYRKLKDLTAKLQNELEKMKYTKKEIALWEKERQKLESFYGGTKDMQKPPSVLFIIDTHLEELAVHEANELRIPVVGVVDTNADPDPVTYPIPANDDAAGSIKLIVSYIVDAWIEGKKKAAKGEETEVTKKQSDKETKDIKEKKSAKDEGKKENKEQSEKETKKKTEKKVVKTEDKKQPKKETKASK